MQTLRESEWNKNTHTNQNNRTLRDENKRQEVQSGGSRAKPDMRIRPAGQKEH